MGVGGVSKRTTPLPMAFQVQHICRNDPKSLAKIVTSAHGLSWQMHMHAITTAEEMPLTTVFLILVRIM